MMMVSLSSGSKGNCTLVRTDTETILIDCGITAKKIDEGLKELGLSLSEVDAVLVTHEHADHIRGLKRLMNSYGIPVYTSYGTASGLYGVTRDEYFRYCGDRIRLISADTDFYIGNTLVRPFRIYHDTMGPLGFRLEQEQAVCGRDVAVCVMTDCGHYDDYIRENLMGLDALLIEANHDPDMLMEGPYPMFLKRRIFSDSGHASNYSCGQLLCEIDSDRLKHVLLGHLSETNNTPQTALQEVLSEYHPGLTRVTVAPQNGLSDIVRV